MSRGVALMALSKEVWMVRLSYAWVAIFLMGSGVFGQQGAVLWPANGATNVCPNTPLRVVLGSAVTLGKGKVEVFDAADDRVVAAVDVGEATRKQAIGGVENFVGRPVLVMEKEAVVCLLPQALGYGKTYYVKVGEGVLRAGAVAEGKEAWRFSTQGAGPAVDAKEVTVAADGTGDFATIQGAIDFFPEGNTAARTIRIKAGTYQEIVCVLRRDNLTLLGADRKTTVIAYANNDRFNPNSGGNPFGAGAPQPGAADPKRDAVYRRGVFLAHQTRGLTVANLTIRNTTPKGGSQAEAIIVNGTTEARTVLANLDLISFQDTLQANGQAYVRDCYIAGDVDFMWGTGPCFFDRVHARAVTNGAIFTTVRCPPPPTTNHGFVFKDCVFDGAAGVMNCFLARIEANRFPTSETVLLNATMSGVVAPAGWQTPTGGDSSKVHFWEFNSHDAEGKAVDVSRRIPASKQLKEPEDHETIAKYGEPAFVLGGEWTPKVP